MSKIDKSKIGGLKVKDPKRAAPETVEEKDTSEDTSWLDEGFIPVEDGVGDSEMANVPGNYIDIPVDDLIPNSWNPNQMNDKTFDMLVRRMREVGPLRPINVIALKDQPGKYMIIDGEHRWKAAKALDWPSVSALVMEGTQFEQEDAQKFLTMQLNQIAGKTSPEKFLKLYNEMVAKYGDKALKDLMGFTDSTKWRVLTKGIADGLPGEMKKKFKEKMEGANPDELGNILQEIMGMYGNDMRYNFMVFTFEDKEHVWIRMNKDTHQLVKDLADTCRAVGLDINIPLIDALDFALTQFTPADDGLEYSNEPSEKEQATIQEGGG